MNGRKLGVAVVAALSLGLLIGSPAAQARKKVVTKTYLQGVGSPTGGTALAIPDGGGPLTQLVRSPINVRGLNPRGKIRTVKVGVRASHAAAKDLEFYLASGQQLRRLLRELCRPIHPVRQQRRGHTDQHPRPAGSLRRHIRAGGEPWSAERPRQQEGDQRRLVAAGRGRRSGQPGGNAVVLEAGDFGDEPAALNGITR
jgi:hypothetical protein